MPLSTDEITEIKAKAQEIISVHGSRTELFARYKDMYWMDNVEQPRGNGTDKDDWKITPSPSSRNEVQGIKRLLDTSNMHITVKDADDAGNGDEIEEGLKRILSVSGETRRARVESDAMLAAVLYGPVVLYAEAVDDLLENKKLKPYKRAYLEKLRKRAPFLIRTINPEESYAEWDDGLILYHVWKYKLRGSAVTSRWGVNANSKMDYVVYDVFTPEAHLVYADGIQDNLLAETHDLGCVPVSIAYSGGSNLFHEPERQMQSFLYAKAKAGLDKRENSILTTLFTSINMRGLLGPLLAVDPDTTPENIRLDYSGGVRIMRANAKQIDDKIIDPIIFQAKQLLDELSGQSTIYRQTLGENGEVSTFSGLAMLSSSGKLPMTDPMRALEHAFKAIFEHILYRIKSEGMDNDCIDPQDIPDEYDLAVTFEPELPQDQLRNASIAQQLGDLVSDEWKQTYLLQIGDTGDMMKQTVKEQVRKALMQNILQDPQVMQSMTAAIMGKPQTPPAPPEGQAPPPQQQEQPIDPMQQGQPPAEAMTPEMMQAMQQQAGGQMPGMEQNPMTDAMTPPMEGM